MNYSQEQLYSKTSTKMICYNYKYYMNINPKRSSFMHPKYMVYQTKIILSVNLHEYRTSHMIWEDTRNIDDSHSESKTNKGRD